MQLARTHYGTQQNRYAIYYSARSSAGTTQWLESLFESSWANYRVGQYEQALGNLITLSSPVLPRRVLPRGADPEGGHLLRELPLPRVARRSSRTSSASTCRSTTSWTLVPRRTWTPASTTACSPTSRRRTRSGSRRRPAGRHPGAHPQAGPDRPGPQEDQRLDPRAGERDGRLRREGRDTFKYSELSKQLHGGAQGAARRPHPEGRHHGQGQAGDGARSPSSSCWPTACASSSRRPRRRRSSSRSSSRPAARRRSSRSTGTRWR